MEPRQKRKKGLNELNDEQLRVLREFQVIVNAAVHCSKKRGKVSSCTYYGRGKSALSRARVKGESILSQWKQEGIPEKCLEYIRCHDESNAIISRYGLDETNIAADREENEDEEENEAAVDAVGPLFGDNDIVALARENASTEVHENQNEEGYQNANVNVTLVSNDSENDSDVLVDTDEQESFILPVSEVPKESIPGVPAENVPSFRDLLRDWVAYANPPKSCVDSLLDRIHCNEIPIDHAKLDKNARALLKVFF